MLKHFSTFFYKGAKKKEFLINTVSKSLIFSIQNEYISKIFLFHRPTIAIYSNHKLTIFFVFYL